MSLICQPRTGKLRNLTHCRSKASDFSWVLVQLMWHAHLVRVFTSADARATFQAASLQLQPLGGKSLMTVRFTPLKLKQLRHARIDGYETLKENNSLQGLCKVCAKARRSCNFSAPCRRALRLCDNVCFSIDDFSSSPTTETPASLSHRSAKIG